MSFIIIAGLFGLLLGSFFNVVAYRLPQMAASGIVRYGKSFWFLSWPLSHCPHCKAPIPWYYNIPLLSFVWLRGRAHCCKKPIGACYPLIELGGGIITATAMWRFGPGLDFALAVIFLSVLLIVSVIDMRRYYILDILVLPLLWLGLLANLDARFALLPDAVLGAAGGYLGLRALAELSALAFKKNVMGGGDFKLMAALGAWLGWQPLPLVLFLASLIGLVYALIHYLLRRAGRIFNNDKISVTGRTTEFLRVFVKGRLYFGPALSLAGAIMLFWGDTLITAYWLYITGSP